MIQIQADAVNLAMDDTIKLKKVLSNQQFENLSAGESNICYLSDVSVTANDNETRIILTANVDMKFKMLSVNKTIDANAAKFDRYVFGLFRMFNRLESYKDAEISTALRLNGVSNLEMSKPEFEDEYIYQTISFQLMVIDTGINEIALTKSNSLAL